MRAATDILTVFTPSTMESIAASSGNLPFNPLGNISTLIDFIANQYFGMMALILPMIYVITVGNKMIAGQVDRGSMAYNLSAPVTRTQVTFTNASVHRRLAGGDVRGYSRHGGWGRVRSFSRAFSTTERS